MKKVITSPKAPQAIGPYSQAIEVNNIIFISGQLGLDPLTGKLLDGIEKQTEQALKNLGEILKEAGLNYENVVKCTILLENMDYFKQVNEIYYKFFKENPPARTTFSVLQLPLGALVEIDAIAIRF